MVGLMFENRRRNRVNGRLTEACRDGLTIKVTQSFGNCPQYIQARAGSLEVADRRQSQPATSRSKLDAADRALIEAADTLFIASVSETPGVDARHGADMSHRGGAPGFVKILEDGSLLIPDFSGNRHFNTLGNILETGKAGLLFMDFANGDLLQLTGTASIVWPEDSPYIYDSAERYVRITPTRLISRPAALPFRWTFREPSPYLPAGAVWHRAHQSALRPYRLANKVREAAGITSFYLSPEDQGVAPGYRAGQHLPIEVMMDGVRHRRTYTLSQAANPRHLRISIKREENGTVSRFLHDRFAAGDILYARPPAGDFTLAEDSNRPAVFLSAGVGITPMMAMAEARLMAQPNSPMYFLHGTRQLRAMPFHAQLLAWERAHDSFKLWTAESAPEDGSRSLRLDKTFLKEAGIPLDADFYLCGPSGFMESLYSALQHLGVEDTRIRFEAFGPSTLKRSTAHQPAFDQPVAVHFARSGKTARWEPSTGSLLELAEAAGIDAPFSCRSGNCGSCAVRLVSGQADHSTASFIPDVGELLTCCALPADDSGAPLEIDL